MDAHSPRGWLVALFVSAVALASVLVVGCGRVVDAPIDDRCLSDLDCAGARCFEGVCGDDVGGARVCADDSACPLGQICESGLCVERPDTATGCVATAGCPINTFCITSTGECSALPDGWCRQDAQCSGETPWCSNRAQGESVPGSCAACVVDGDCSAGAACVFGACYVAGTCPINSSPAADGSCVCNDGYVPGEGGTCTAVGGGVLNPPGCPPLEVSCRDFGYSAGTVTRSADCLRIDVSGCVDVCGDGLVGPSEQCDGDSNAFSCQDVGFLDGPLGCTASCVVDASACLSPVCGDGDIEGNEVCEGDALGGAVCADLVDAVLGSYVGGDLVCGDDCRTFDVSQCVLPVCGDGVVEGAEVCDGENLVDATCESVAPGQFTRGALGCAADCRAFDTSACRFGDESEPNNTFATKDRHDNLEDGVSAFFVGNINPAGDVDCVGVPVAAFDIVTIDAIGVNSEALGSCGADTFLTLFSVTGAQLATNDDANGLCSRIVHTATAAGTLGVCLRGFSSVSTFPYRLRTEVRTPVCGDGVKDSNEACDGPALGGSSCFAQGAVSGALACNADCTFDTSACVFPVCGNGVVERNEVCDGDVDFLSCVDEGFTAGTVSCAADCGDVDTSGCRLDVDEVEPNNTHATANPERRPFVGQIVAGDTDCMRLAASAGQRIEARTVGIDDGAIGGCQGDPVLTLHRPDGSQLTSNDDTNGLCPAIVINAPTAGTYSVCVRAFSSSSTLLYRLDASASP
jgi:hypothetical protein